MNSIKKCFIFLIIVFYHLTNHPNISFGQQHAIGITSGYNVGTFLNLSKQENYETKYKLKSGFSLASFYETRKNAAVGFKLGLNYSYQKADMNVNQVAGHYSTFTNMDYSFHLLDLNLNLVFHLIEKEKFKMNLFLGPTFNYIFNTSATGEGWNFYMVSKQYWEKDERNSKDLSRFNAGVGLGLDFLIPINEQLDFLIQNRYTLLITNLSKVANTPNTSLFIGGLQVGLRFQLKK